MKRLTLGLMLAGFVLASSLATGQDYTGRSIQEVRLQGLERVNEQLVRSKLEVRPGQPFNSRAIARDIRRLYELGFFSNILADMSPTPEGLVLTYIVQEKRVIQEVKIIGNQRLKDRQIRAVLDWREGDSFVPEAYDDEREAVLNLYQSKGFPNTRVDIIVQEIGESRVRIIYEIDEGGKARIRKIRFEGNDSLSARKLRKVMETKPAWWFLGGKYDERVFENDLDAIVDYYGNFGHLESAVTGTDFDYDDRGKHVAITIYLDEGAVYTVESLQFAGNTVYDDPEVLRLLKVMEGDVHDKGQVAKDAQLVQRGYEDSGYINANVVPQVTLDREKKTTHVVERIDEDELKYIEEVTITGNTVTRDEVVRREVLLNPGERFDGGLLRASQSRLEGTEFFDTVRFTKDYENYEDDAYNLLVDVEEGKTGFFNFGAGYSTEEKFSGFTELRLNNFDIGNPPSFSGGGQQFRLRLNLGQRRDQYYLAFTDPEVFGYPLLFGFDVFNETYQYTGGANYTEETSGGQIRFGKILSPYVTTRLALRYADSEVTGLPWYAWLTEPVEFVEQLEGSTTVSAIWGISRNTQDSKLDATRGSRHDLQLQFAGLGGDNHFYKVEHDSIWYWSLDDESKWVLSFRTREGWANEYGSSRSVPLQDRFFAGGTTTVRGYENRDIGPKARSFFGLGDAQAVGGEARMVQNLELKYKLTEQVRFYTFVDGGGVWESFGDVDLGDMKFAAGLGFGVDVPRMGPIRVDYGIPINPDEDQGNGRLHLQTGFRF